MTVALGVGEMQPFFAKIDCLSLPVIDLDQALGFYQHSLALRRWAVEEGLLISAGC